MWVKVVGVGCGCKLWVQGVGARFGFRAQDVGARCGCRVWVQRVGAGCESRLRLRVHATEGRLVRRLHRRDGASSVT